MMKIKFNILTIVTLYGCHVAALGFERCSLSNSTCQKNFYQSVARDHAFVGFPEIGVPILDPFHLENVIIYVLKFVKLTLIEGDCLGISTCRLLKYETRLTDFHKIAVIKCARVVIQGSYTISSHPKNNHIGNASGNGNMSIVLEDWFFKFDYPFRLVKHEDGEIYTKAYFEFGEYTSVVLKNATVTADNIMWNNQDVTADVLAHMNKNWWKILTKFCKSFHDKSVEFYYVMYNLFFDNVPANKYLSDDLTQYV